MKAPFPWYGGKSRVAALVWDAFGDVRNYVEPFAGSLAVLLGRPTEAKIETVNDLDCLIANFWRAMQAAPEAVAAAADWPVNEADLHARHIWLVEHVHGAKWREQMMTSPDFYDAKVAGWWVWGISQWIGSGWCAEPFAGQNRRMGRSDGTPQRGRPNLQTGQGVNQLITPGRGAAGKGSPRGVQAVGMKRPLLTSHGGGIGVHSQKNRQTPASDPWRKRSRLASGERGETKPREESGLYGWFQELAERLRRVRVCCGDWQRILGPAPTTCIGMTGVFLDPPYAVEDRSDVYAEDSREVAHDVRAWAIENGDNPELRIALCGYEGEHAMPTCWREVRWKANGGFANQASGATQGRANAARERIWFSPHCLHQQPGLFEPPADLT